VCKIKEVQYRRNYNMNNNLLNNDNADKDENKSEVKDKIENVKELGNTTLATPDKRIQVLSIIGQIEGHSVLPPQTKATKYEHIIPQLIDIEQNEETKGLLIVLNTVGGDVEAGLAIAEMIHSMSKPTVSLVIGGGHSIGVPLATSSDFSFITPSATMIVHPVRMNGFVIGVSQTFEYFKKMQGRINEFIVRTSSIKQEVLEEFMLQTDDLLNDVGTMLIGKQAVDCGLIDEVGGVHEALDKLNELIEKE
jgi:ATP-dependent protease ClpP protease subunit